MNKKSLFLILFLSIVSVAVFAQPYVSQKGRFQVDQKKGCAPFTLNLTNLLPGTCIAGVSPCAIDYENTGSPVTNAPLTHTYNTPGTYTLTVIYQSLADQKDFITITVVENIQPSFEIYACSGNQARIKVTDNHYEQYVIDYNNDNTPEATLPFSNNILGPSYTYTPPGTYTASVRGRNTGSADNCTAKTQPFSSIAVLPTPKINTLTSVDASNIKLDFTIAANVEYKLEIAVNSGTAFQPLQTLFGITTVTVPNLKLDDNYYCFRLGAFDPCNNVNTYSNVICSSKFTATAASDVNQLAWTTSTGGVTTYSINRGTGLYASLASPAASTYNDTGIVCKTQYCYQLVINYSGGAKSIGLSKCVTSFSTKVPTGITNVSSVVNDGGVDLTWSQDPAFIPVSYAIERSTVGSPFGSLASVSATKFTDNLYTTASKYCYRIGYVDKCDNSSPPGIVTCPVRLNGTLDKKNVVTLTWSGYKGWKSGVKNYIVEKYNLQGQLIKTFTVTDSTLVDDQPDPANQLVRYEVKAISNEAGLTISVSNIVQFIKEANLYYPKAFTPNGDKLNDDFNVTGQFIVKMSLKIFDRWGNIVFASDKNEPWNGQREGKQLPPSTYVWKAEITDLAGRTFAKDGTIVLMN